MSILASCAVEIAGRRASRRFEAATKDPVGVQTRKLVEITQCNKDTKYGRECSFASVRRPRKPFWVTRFA